MKKISKLFVSMLCAAVLVVPVIAGTACEQTPKHVDYAAAVELNLNSETLKQQVTVRTTVDGDTTHFNPVASPSYENCNHAADFSSATAPTKGYAKARYIAINTPESTGQIEPWGKKASNFTKEKLKSAKDIIIESDDDQWNIDSTGTRYVLWVWYNTEENPTFRNLNIEILQSGLAYGSSTSENRYGEIAYKALEQARAEALNIYSGEKDPDFDYSDTPLDVDLKELRFNADSYVGRKIATKGLVVADYGSSCYIEQVYSYPEDFDEFEGLTNPPAAGEVRIGMPILHFNNNSELTLLQDVLVTGNYVRVVGVLVFWEEGGYYQITDLQEINEYNDDDPENCTVIDTPGMDSAFTEISAAAFASTEKNYGVVTTVDGEDEIVKMSFAAMLEGSSVSITGAKVVSMWTTQNGDNAGAITITCQIGSATFDIRTSVFYKEDGKTKYTEADFEGKTLDVKGIVGAYKGGYQINCYKVDLMNIYD